jgi:hypothetical protein
METNDKFGGDINLKEREKTLKQIEASEIRMNEIMKKRQEIRANINADKSKSEEDANKKGAVEGGISEDDQKIVDSRNAAYFALQDSYVAHAAWEAEQDLMKRKITDDNFQSELDQLRGIEQEKINAKFDAEEQKINLEKDSATKKLMLDKLASDKSLAIQRANVDAEKRLKDKQAADEAANAQLRIASLGNFLGASAALMKQGTKEQQALSIAQALMSTYEAAANALKLQPVWPLGISTAALVTAQGLAQVRNITSQKFNYGGIVKGNSMTGDTIPARVNSGEMILNRQQQSELFNIANGSGGGNDGLRESIDRLTRAISNQAIQVHLDGRKIAESVRSQVQSGFRLG